MITHDVLARLIARENQRLSGLRKFGPSAAIASLLVSFLAAGLLSRMVPAACWWGAAVMLAVPSFIAPAFGFSAYAGDAAADETRELLLTRLTPAQLLIGRLIARAIPLSIVVLLVETGIILGISIGVGPPRLGMLLSSAIAGLGLSGFQLTQSLLVSRRFQRLATAVPICYGVSVAFFLYSLVDLFRKFLAYSASARGGAEASANLFEFPLITWLALAFVATVSVLPWSNSAAAAQADPPSARPL